MQGKGRVFLLYAVYYNGLSSYSYLSSLAPATTGQAHWDSSVCHVTLPWAQLTLSSCFPSSPGLCQLPAIANC